MNHSVTESQLRRLCDELETRLRDGQRNVSEDYLNIPEIASDQELALELIYREFTILEELHERPETDRFVNRFPQWKEAIDRLLEVHAAFADPDSHSLPEGSPESREHELHADLASPVGTTIGKYKVLQEIGEGGFGIVYMAEQLTPIRRKVALKVVKPGMDTRAAIARFEAERQALAMMEHPNIARVLDAGATSAGRPYFVMDLVTGIPISDFCDQRNLTTIERLQLFKTVCDAVQHAHGKGIIHRDLKPSNVMITLYDGVPVPKIIDFGIAKALNQPLTDKTLFTRYGQMLGTPMYMSPEQAEMSGLDIDIRSDVYSLGVLLYELLTGTAPLSEERLRAASYADLVKMIIEDDPPTPSTRLQTLGETITDVCSHRDTDLKRLSVQLRGDLDRIVMKALEKDRKRRYETVKDLASDVNRYLHHQPVYASSPSTWYRIRKFTRRNRAIVFSTTAVLLALALGFLLAVMGLLSARRQQSIAQAAELRERDHRERAEREGANARLARDQERIQRERVETNLYFQQISRAHREWQSGELQNATQILSECSESKRDWEWHYLQRQCQSSERTMHGHSTIVRRVEISPDGQWIASASNLWNDRRPGEAILWDLASGKSVHLVGQQPGGIRDIAFSPDSRLLAGVSNAGGGIRVWKVDSGSIAFAHAKPSFEAACFRPDGKQLAAADVSGKVHLFDTSSGRPLRTLDNQSSRVFDVAYHPQGHLLAGVTHAGYVNIWDSQTGHLLHRLPHAGNRAIDFSPDGKLLATAGYSGSTAGLVQIFEISGSVVRPIADHTTNFGSVGSVRFSPDSQVLALTSTDAMVRFWKPRTGHQLRSFRAHDGITTSIDFSPDGRHLVTGGTDRTVNFWTLSDTDTELILRSQHAFVKGMEFSPDNQFIALAGGLNQSSPGRGKKTVQLWRLPDRGAQRLVAELDGFDQWMPCLAYSPDGNSIAVGGDQGAVRVWNTKQHSTVVEFDAHTRGITCIDYSDDSSMLITGCRDGTIGIWNASNGRIVTRWPAHAAGVRSIDLHPELEIIASVGGDGDLSLWQSKSATKLQTSNLSRRGPLTCVAFSHDGRRLAVGDEQGNLQLWVASDPINRNPERSIIDSAPQFHHQHTFTCQQEAIVDVAFHPNGTRLASLAADGITTLWDLDSYHEAIRLRPSGQNANVLALTFSADGQRLAAARAGRVTIWNAAERVERQPGSLVDRQQIVAWHQENADLCWRNDNWAGVIFHCDHLLARAPEHTQYLARRGSAFAAMGNWQAAFADCSRATELGQNQIDDQYALALVQLKLGNVEAYRGTCRSILASLIDPTSDSRYHIHLVAKICALAPDSVPDLTSTIGFLNSAANRSDGYARHVYQNILGLILLRSNQYQSAIDHLSDGLAHAIEPESPHDWLVLAMAHHRLGNHDQASEWFELAAWAIERIQSGSAGSQTDWKRLLEMQLLRDEAAGELEAARRRSAETQSNTDLATPVHHWADCSILDRQRIGWHLNRLDEAELNRDHLAAIEHLNILIDLRPLASDYYLRRSRSLALMANRPIEAPDNALAQMERAEAWRRAEVDFQHWKALDAHQAHRSRSSDSGPPSHVPADTFEVHSIENWKTGDWQRNLLPRQ